MERTCLPKSSSRRSVRPSISRHGYSVADSIAFAVAFYKEQQTIATGSEAGYAHAARISPAEGTYLWNRTLYTETDLPLVTRACSLYVSTPDIWFSASLMPL